MSSRISNKYKIINHWLEDSDEDYETMLSLFNTKRYSWSLFIGHIVIEKLLKALYVQENETHPPFVHNLLRLAIDSKLELTDEIKYQLTTITAFNLNTRYDDYKRSFQKKCTPEFSTEWLEIIKILRVWIKEQIKK